MIKSKVGWYPSGQLNSPINNLTNPHGAFFNQVISHSAITYGVKRFGPQGTARHPTGHSKGARQQLPKYAVTEATEARNVADIPLQQQKPVAAIVTAKQITTPRAKTSSRRRADPSQLGASSPQKPSSSEAISQSGIQQPCSTPYPQSHGTPVPLFPKMKPSRVALSSEASPHRITQQFCKQSHKKETEAYLPQNLHFFNYSVADSPFFWHEDLADFHNFRTTLIFCSSKLCPDFLAKNGMNC